MTTKTRVLFVCVHNAARSQMAEAWLHRLAGDRCAAESAGLEPGTLNPIVVEAMREVGMDISRNRTKDIFAFIRQGRRYDYVITVCDAAAAERCPVFPGATTRLHWSFPDPARFTGTPAEVLAQTRRVRDAIHARIETWIASLEPKEVRRG